MALTREDVAKLYVATFNRAPDAAGLDYWLNDSEASNLEELGNAMLASPEASATNTGSDTDFLESLYANLFNREADEGGLAYWLSELESGNVSRESMVATLIKGAEAPTGSAEDKAIMDNKTTVGLEFAEKGLSSKEDASAVLANVTADTSTVTAAVESVVELYDAAVEAGEIVVETPQVEEVVVPTSSGSASFVPDYTPQAVAKTLEEVADMEWIDLDAALSITGTGNATMTDEKHDFLKGFDVRTAVDSVVTLSDEATITTFATVGTTYILGDFTNVVTLGAAQTITGGTGVDTINGSAGNDTMTFEAQDILDGLGGVDTLKISNATTSAAGDLTITGGAVTKFEGDLQGAGSFTGSATHFENYDLTGSTGATNITAETTTTSIIGSEGNDVINAGAIMTNLVTIDGGIGSDSLTMQDATGAINDLDSVTNIETVILSTGADVAITLAADFGAALESRTFDGAALDGDNNTFTLNTTASAANYTIDLSGADSTGAVDIDTGAGDDIVKVKVGTANDINTGEGNDQVTGGTAVDTITTGAGDDQITGMVGADVIDMGAGNDTLIINAAVSAAAGTIDMGTQTTYDTLYVMTGNINFDETVATAEAIKITDAAHINNTQAETVIDLAAMNNTKIGNADTFDNVSNVLIVDASLVDKTNGIQIVTNATADNVILGSTGADLITYSGGNDNIDGKGGADTLSITHTLLEANSGTTAVFKGDAGTDIILVSDNAADIEDADFRGITSFETITLADGDVNTVVLGTNADSAGIVTINAANNIDTITVNSSATTYKLAGGVDVITLLATTTGLTIDDSAATTDDPELVLTAWQNAAADWSAEEANVDAVNAADKWFFDNGTGVLSVWNENKTDGAGVSTVTLVGVNDVIDHTNNGSLTIDVA